jgi:hypothetical protein
MEEVEGLVRASSIILGVYLEESHATSLLRPLTQTDSGTRTCHISKYVSIRPTVTSDGTGTLYNDRNLRIPEYGDLGE